MIRFVLSIFLSLCLLVPSSWAQDSGLKTIPSSKNTTTTILQLENAIKSLGMKVFTKIDHSAAATEFGLQMPPATVIIFGNPKGGTPNFLKQPTLAIDLPLKMLVWENKHGKTFVTYNSGSYVFGTIFPRHGLNLPGQIIQKQEKMLSKFAGKAAK